MARGRHPWRRARCKLLPYDRSSAFSRNPGGPAGRRTIAARASEARRLPRIEPPWPLRGWLRLSALDCVQRKAALRRLLVFGLHIRARRPHGCDDLVERDAVRSIPTQCERSGGDRLVGAEGVALDARDLDEAADRVAGHAEMVLHS